MKLFVCCLLVTSLASISWAIQIREPIRGVRNPVADSKFGPNFKDLEMTTLEKSVKNDLIRMRIKDNQTLEDLKSKGVLSNLQRGLVDEVSEMDLTQRGSLPKKSEKDLVSLYSENPNIKSNYKLSLAKRIAKKQMMQSLLKNWPRLKSSSVNLFNVTKEADAKKMFINMMRDGFYYFPRQDKPESYVFKMDDVGFVELDKKTLTQGQVVIEFNFQNDLNKLQPGAEQIHSNDQIEE